MITTNAYRMLKLLEKGTYFEGISAKWLSWKLWGNNSETEHLSYTRKGWLQVGSQMGKLIKKGLATYDKHFTGYYLTNEGKKAIKEYEQEKVSQ